MKVDITQYKSEILKVLKRRQSPELSYSSIIDLIENNLLCVECKKVLPLDSFSKSASFVNRKGRYTVCKACCKSLRKPRLINVDQDIPVSVLRKRK